jgi:hemerythrin
MEKKYKSIEDKINRLTLNQTKKPNTYTQFYPRVVNETAIKFSDEEITLLNKGLKYNLSHKRKHWLNNLASEVENAIMLLPTQEQDYLRCQVAHNLQILYKQQKDQHTKPNLRNTNENRIINQIRKILIMKKL